MYERQTSTRIMADNFYLTDTLYVCGDKMYHETERGPKPVKRSNWHIHLQEYGYRKLPKRWISLLNLEADVRPKNSPYGSLDCERDGDCLYHCIANALNERDGYEISHTNMTIRDRVCEGITEDDYQMCIGCYRAMKDASDFDNEWDPHQIETIQDFREVLRTKGHSYWGDYLILGLLIRILRLNIVILTSDEFTGNHSLYQTGFSFEDTTDTVCLLHENRSHFQLVGHFDGDRMVSYFRGGSLPSELRALVSR